MAKYNGFKNYNAWNVCMWLFNNENYSDLVESCLNGAKNKTEAAKRLIAMLPDKTPDGVKYTLTNVRLALSGI